MALCSSIFDHRKTHHFTSRGELTRYRLESSRRCSTFGPKDLRNSTTPRELAEVRLWKWVKDKPGNEEHHTPIFVWNIHDIWHDALNNKKVVYSLNSQRGNWGSWEMHDLITVLPLLIWGIIVLMGKKPTPLGMYKTLWKWNLLGIDWCRISSINQYDIFARSQDHPGRTTSRFCVPSEAFPWYRDAGSRDTRWSVAPATGKGWQLSQHAVWGGWIVDWNVEVGSRWLCFFPIGWSEYYFPIGPAYLQGLC